MEEQEWLETQNATTAYYLLPEDADERKLRLLVCACCRRVWDSMGTSSQLAVKVAERFADGEASENERATVEREDFDQSQYEEMQDEKYYVEFVRPIERSEIAAETALNALSANVRILVWSSMRSAREVLGSAEDHVESSVQADLIRDIFGNPFRPVALDPRWRTSNVVDLAQAIYQDRAFDRMPILADALMDAGCDSEEIINHCRGDGPHVRGCWVVDLLLGKE